MGKTRYRVEENTPTGMAKRSAGKALPLALIGLAGYFAWQKRDQLGGLAQQLKDKFAGAQNGDLGRNGGAETIPDDYDYSRPSVFNSTAMAGPQGGAGGTTGLAGGSMGTDLGTQGESAL